MQLLGAKMVLRSAFLVSALAAYTKASSTPPYIKIDSPRTCKGFEKEQETCHADKPCTTCIPVDCFFSAWTDWYQEDGCIGLCIRQRGIGEANNQCGKPCSGEKIMTKKCPAPGCAPKKVDCKLSEWSMWTACEGPGTSQFGQRYSSRAIVIEAEAGGVSCVGALNRTKSCGAKKKQDCILSDWGAYTPCSKTCGGGLQAKLRRIIQSQKDGGAVCSGDLRFTRECNTQPCKQPKPCEVSPWSEWVGCTVGELQKYRQRKITSPQIGLQSTCSYSLHETAGCIKEQPPVDCVLDEWTDWSSCDTTCDGGQMVRVRHLLAPPKNRGDCPSTDLMVTKPCNTMPCRELTDMDCKMGVWSDWSQCSETCDIGEQFRSRKVLHNALPGGVGCTGLMKEVKKCDLPVCATNQDCVWGSWAEWSGCSCPCGGGTKQRMRAILKAPRGIGKKCTPKLKTEMAPCNQYPCETCINGTWMAWSEWTTCSATCEAGYRSRHRAVASQPNNCGVPATGLEDEYKLCTNTGAGGAIVKCSEDQDCLLGEWGSWSSCSCSCFGIRERTRVITQYAKGLGKTCKNNALKLVEQCNPVIGQRVPMLCHKNETLGKCSFTAWSAWEDCDVTCNGGQTFRTRQATPSVPGVPLDSSLCQGALKEWRSCNMHSCSETCVDCKWGAWGEWSACGKECTSQKYRWRHVDQMPNHCGLQCTKESSKEAAVCKGTCTVPKYCAWTEWAAIGTAECSDHCGPSIKLRQRSLAIFESVTKDGYLIKGEGFANKIGTCNFPCGGTMVDQIACPKVDCIVKETPIDCVFGAWSMWNEGSGMGLCDRHRVIATMNDHGGTPCDGALEETKTCTVPGAAPMDCRLSAWEEWSSCDSNGQRFRSRVTVQPALHGGRGCEDIIYETLSCTTSNKKQDCAMEAWSDWQRCSVTCEGGTMTRERRIAISAAYGGKPCDNEAMQEIAPCNVNSCDGEVDCKFSDWYVEGSSPNCPTNCTDGQMAKMRTVAMQASRGGKACDGPLKVITPCHTKVDCVTSPWTEWDTCDRLCGGGQKMRHRQVTQNPLDGGKACPDVLVETAGCSEEPCHAVDCRWKLWTGWGKCESTANCGTGQKLRSRSIDQFAGPGGQGCEGPMLQTMECTVTFPSGEPKPCFDPVDCVWGEWGDWSHCTCDCDGGQKERYRDIKVHPRNGGKMCEVKPKHTISPCNTQPCPSPECIDGVWDEWSDWGKCSVTCGGGTTSRYRKVLREASSCGKIAEGLAVDVANCYSAVPCEKSVPCMFADWNDWSGCTAECNGVKRRERVIKQNGKGDGEWCVGPVKESAPCDAGANCGFVPESDCVISDWSPWGFCSETCGGGVATRSRRVLQEKQGNGKECPHVLTMAGPCNTKPCDLKCESQDCVWGEWGEWSACDKCGGQKRRFRHVLSLPKCGGKACDYKDAEYVTNCTRQCHEKTYCGWADWDIWTKCSAMCGVGSRMRLRHLAIKTTAEVSRFLLENASSLQGLDLEEEVLEASLRDLKMRATDLQARRMQEMVVAFSTGLASIVIGFALFRTLPRCLSSAQKERRDGSTRLLQPTGT